MLSWWEDNGPPVYISVASYLGLNKPKDKKKPRAKQVDADSSDNEANLENLVRMFSGSNGDI